MAKKSSAAKTDETGREKERTGVARGGEFRAARARGSARDAADSPPESASEPGLEQFDLGAALLVVDRSGWVVRSSGWEAALRRLHADPGLSLRLGEAGRRTVEAGYSVTSGTRLLAETYRLAAADVCPTP